MSFARYWSANLTTDQFLVGGSASASSERKTHCRFQGRSILVGCAGCSWAWFACSIWPQVTCPDATPWISIERFETDARSSVLVSYKPCRSGVAAIGGCKGSFRGAVLLKSCAACSSCSAPLGRPCATYAIDRCGHSTRLHV